LTSLIAAIEAALRPERMSRRRTVDDGNPYRPTVHDQFLKGPELVVLRITGHVTGTTGSAAKQK